MKNASLIEEKVLEIAGPFAEALGLDIIAVEYKTHSKDKLLSVFIDKKGGVNLDDCSALSLAIEPVLDEEDIISTGYILEVSSPGIDRPLESDRDLERNKGMLVEIKLKEHVDKRLKFEGILDFYDSEGIVIILDEPFVKGVKPKTNGEKREFLRSNIISIKKAVRF